MLRWFSDLRLVLKIAFPVAVLLLAVGAAVWQAGSSLSRLSASLDTATGRTALRNSLAFEVEAAVNSAGIAEKNAIIESNPAAVRESAGLYEERIARAKQAAERILPLALPERRAVLERMGAMIGQYDAVARRAIALSLEHRAAGPQAISCTEGRRVRAELAALVKDVTDYNTRTLAAARKEGSELAASAMGVLHAVAGSGLTAATGLLAYIVARVVAGPLAAMTGSMQAIAGGDLSVEVRGTERGDEVGALARALRTFRDNALRMRQLEADAAGQMRQAELGRRAALARMADTFEAGVKGVVDAVAAAATEMESAAQSMAATAEQASHQATAVAAASGQASANVGTVAGPTEELSASIQEISRQVATSTRIAGQAVGEAGEAGKGFAVVASEVKALAQQTQRATEEIAAQAQGVRDSTGAATRSIDGVAATIGRMSEIAAAMEEQQAATRDIAGNVAQGAQGTAEVSGNIAGATQAAAETEAAASQVLGAAGGLSREAETLRGEVSRFLATVRAA